MAGVLQSIMILGLVTVGGVAGMFALYVVSGSIRVRPHRRRVPRAGVVADHPRP